MFQVLVRRLRDERGQGLAEYALILGLLAVVSIAALVFMGSTISMLLSQIGDTLVAPTPDTAPAAGRRPARPA